MKRVGVALGGANRRGADGACHPPMDTAPLRMDWRERIVSDPRVCHGRACIRGTRVLVSVLLDNLAAGVPTSEIVASYPTVVLADILAAISYAAELTREQVIDLGTAG